MKNSGGTVDESQEQEPPRGTAARVGICALNTITPGLGLVRAGSLRAGFLAQLAVLGWFAAVVLAMGHAPITGVRSAVAALVLLCCVTAGVFVWLTILTWRRSRLRRPLCPWSRWYGLVGLALLGAGVSQAAVAVAHIFYKPFYVPAESMAPTLLAGDKFIADMRWRGPMRRGHIVLFLGPDNVRVSRVVALAGDRVAMRGGVPVLNGRVVSVIGGERLPGEATSHRVLDDGPSPFDDMPERLVPSGHIFVLGDNRDRSADSRVPVEQFGVGMVPLDTVLGRPMYIHWSTDRSRIGLRLDR